MKKIKVTLLTSVGAGLEYYDFVIYAMLATYISKNFFQSDNTYIALIETFAVFAIGYVVRPLGGIVFGIIGDKFGRKISFTYSIIIMAAATFFMGIIPSYSSIGITATILFTFLRLLQGISYGAEMPGALTFLCEHLEDNTRGSHCGIMIMCVGIGTSFASFILYLLTCFLNNEQILNFGWRIPFILGSFLGVLGFYIRKKISETPHFQNEVSHPGFALFNLFQKNFFSLVKALGIMLFPACFVVFFLYVPTLLKESSAFTMKTISIVVTIGYLWSTVLIPFFGWLSDKITRRKLMLFAVLFFLIAGVPLFSLIKHNSLLSLIIFVLGYHTIIAAMAGCYFTMLPEVFPTSTRFTGVALAYNLAYLIASLIPIISNIIMSKTSNVLLLSIMLIIVCLLTVFSLLSIKTENVNKLS